MIDEKTLGAVLGYRVEKIHKNGGDVWFKYKNGGYSHIKHGDLMLLCKDWALQSGWALSSGVADTTTKIRFATITKDCFNTHKTFNEKTERKAIYKACKFIRKQ